MSRLGIVVKGKKECVQRWLLTQSDRGGSEQKRLFSHFFNWKVNLCFKIKKTFLN